MRAGLLAFAGIACLAALLWHAPPAWVQFDTSQLTPRLQAWRENGRYHVHNVTASNTLHEVGIFYVDHTFPHSSSSKVSSRASNRTIVLLHGFPSSSADYAGHFFEGLAERFDRVVALDFLGFGFSDKPRTQGLNYSLMMQADIVEDLLAARGVRTAWLLAHDVGDTVAQELLARHNARATASARAPAAGGGGLALQGVALLNGGLFPEMHRPLLVQTLLRQPVIGPLLAAVTGRARLAASLASVFGPQTPPSQEFVEDTWAGMAFNGGPLLLPRLIRYIDERLAFRERWVGALQQTQVPLVLINGPGDPISGRHAAERWAELLPHQRLTLLPDHIGHYPQVEAPDLVLHALYQFVDQVAAARKGAAAPGSAGGKRKTVLDAIGASSIGHNL